MGVSSYFVTISSPMQPNLKLESEAVSLTTHKRSLLFPHLNQLLAAQTEVSEGKRTALMYAIDSNNVSGAKVLLSYYENPMNFMKNWEKISIEVRLRA